MITTINRIALYCYSVVTNVIGCILYFTRAEMVVESGLEKLKAKQLAFLLFSLSLIRGIITLVYLLR